MSDHVLSSVDDRGIATITINRPERKNAMGFQMLGSRVTDPTGVEGEVGEDIALNLLPLITVLEPRKELAQVEGTSTDTLPFAERGTSFKGYEIHVGRTINSSDVDTPLAISKRLSESVNEPAGAISEDGLVFGCYVHGFFDNEPMRKQLLNWLCKRKNIEPPDWNSPTDYLDSEIDRLTDHFTAHVDIRKMEELSAQALV